MMKKFTFLTGLMMTAMLMVSLNLLATDYMVSGAGSNSVNGVYEESGEMNGKPYYVGGEWDDCELYWDGSQWNIEQWGDISYYNTTDSATPPENGWERDYGSSPAPTVTIAKTMEYDGSSFYEAAANNGSITNQIRVELNGPAEVTFTGSNGTFNSSNYNTANVPVGLTVSIERISDTELAVSLTGTASSHAYDDDITNMEIAFLDAAFNNATADEVINATKSDYIVNYGKVIATLNDLKTLSETSADWDEYFIQTADIDASGTATWDDGDGGDPEGFNPIARGSEFTGGYNGGGHTIDGLFINRPDGNGKVGLFARLRVKAFIWNLGLTEVDITGDNNATGALAGYLYATSGEANAIIKNCYATGNVAGVIQVGGLVGAMKSHAKIEQSFSSCNVTGTNRVGGLVGDLYNLNLSYNEGYVINSYSTGNVMRTSGSETYIGGFVGIVSYNAAVVRNCYSTGDVFESDGVAWSSGDKGFLGGGYDSNFSDNFFDNVASNQSTATGATAKDTDAMQTQSTFTGWDFETIWSLSPTYNNGYPNLDDETNYTDITWLGNNEYSPESWGMPGNWDLGVVPTSIHNVIITTNGTAPEIDSYVECNNLTVNSGATLTIKYSGSLITYGSITNDGTIVTEQKFWESQYDNEWAMIAMPNNTTQAGDYFEGMYLQQWNETTAFWEDVIETETALSPVRGYSLWDPAGNTFTYTGTPNTGNQSIGISFTDNGTDYDGANFVGNPYPSYLDWDVISGYGSKYTWDGTAYKAYTQTGSYGAGQKYVSPTQGFFVVVNTGGTFDLDNSMRCHPPGVGKSAEKTNLQNGLILTASNGSYEDELWLVFNEKANKNFELQRDAWKLLSSAPGLSQLWSVGSDGKMSVDVRPEQETIQLGFTNDEAGFYSIRLEEIEGISQATLEDTKLNLFINLANGAYNFDWQTTDSEERFILHLKATGTSDLEAQAVQVYGVNGQIYVSLSGVNYNQMRVYDLSGRLVYQNQLNSSSLQSFSPRLISGVYLVELNGENGVKSFKIVL